VAEPVFQNILCGVDGSRPSAEAARQAAALASPGGHVEVVAVSSVGSGRTVLEDACRRAAKVDVSATWNVIAGSDVAKTLLEECAGYDLIAIGSTGTSPERNLFGRTASAIVHGSNVPVLIARHPEKGSFPDNVLLASDASPASDRAATLVARIGSAHDAKVTVVHVDGATTEARWALARETAELLEATGREPVVVEVSGDPDEEIARVAAQTDASLVVIGSRGLEGIKAMWSVSERVVRMAPCSVLVARPPS
jgi:nucleotide-binding universal stress UspA family protein